MSESAPRSPCINVCKLDSAGVCIGCGRSGDEIARWRSMSADEQWQVVRTAERRRADRQAVGERILEKVVDVNDRIKQQISSAPVVLFMKGTPDFPQCGFSAQTVAALKACGAKFNHVNIFEDPELRDALKKFSNWPTYPQLYIKGELVGGCDIAVEMYHSGELKKALQTAGAV